MHPPVISTLICTDYLADFVKHRFELGQTIQCSMLRRGINHTYLITADNEKFVLRIYSYNWRTKKEIEEELRFLNLLKDKGIKVSYPIANIEGTYVQSINAHEGERWVVLFSYAPGEIVRNPSEKSCFQLGQTMARIHDLAVDHKIERKSYNSSTLSNWAYTKAEGFFKSDSDQMKYMKRACLAIEEKWKNAATSELRSGTVHLDMWYENMKIDDESNITLFDFDNCGNGWLFLDIGYSLMLLFKNEPDKEIFELKLKSFYKGYESIGTVTEEEKRLMPYAGLAIWIHYAGIHVHRFDDWSNVFLSEEFLKYWIDTVKIWMEYNGIKI